jgi:hypothetical protein
LRFMVPPAIQQVMIPNLKGHDACQVVTRNGNGSNAMEKNAIQNVISIAEIRS